MLTMRDHGVDDYVALRDMDSTDVGVITEDDQACLDDVGQYLVAADAWQRFGIWVLHKHFEPKPGEIFVESVMHAARRTRTALVERSSAEALNATAVRFDPAADSGVGIIGMEFATPADFGPASPLSADDEAVLAGIAEHLERHGKADRFGVRLVRNPLSISGPEVLLETSDDAHRTLQCDVSTREQVGANHRLIETTWQWKPERDASGIKAVQACYVTCLAGDENHNLLHSP
jgi:hypothetical protein